MTETARLLDRLEVGRVHYVAEGASVGIGVSFAATYPERVASLTLISAPAKVDAGIRRHHAVGFADWEEAIVKLGTREWWMQARSGNEFVGRPIDHYMADEAGKVDPLSAIAFSHWATTWDLRESLPRIDVPVLFLWADGRNSPVQEELLSLAPNARRGLVPGVTSQLMAYTDPDIVAPVVANFLQGSEDELA